MPKISVGLRLRPDATNYPRLDQLNVSPDQTSIELFVSSTLHSFTFDRIFPDDASQLDIYRHSAHRLVENALEGYNGCIFAYGQTGAGKTHTMTGALDADTSQYGISAQAAVHLFQRVRGSSDSMISLRLSIVEIYNETLLDLLTDLPPASSLQNYNGTKGGGGKVASKLNILETADAGVMIPGLHVMPIDSIDDTLTLLMEAQANRAVAEHQLNHASSRSHIIYTYYITRTSTPSSSSSSAAVSRLKNTARGGGRGSGGRAGGEDKDSDDGTSVIEDPIVHQSKIHIVDLAGSERVNKTGSSGNVQKEANYINRSLSFLEQVVIALSQAHREHVPYRQSKLTYLLKDSLGGNSNTYLIACIWPRRDHAWETLSTLRFAARMKNIETHPVRNRLVSKESSSSQSNGVIRQLSAQNELLKKELALRDFIHSYDSWVPELTKHQLYASYKQGIEFLQRPSTLSNQQQENPSSSSLPLPSLAVPSSIEPIDIHSLSQIHLLLGFCKEIIYELSEGKLSVIEESMERLIERKYLNQQSVHFHEKHQKLGKKLLSLLSTRSNGQHASNEGDEETGEDSSEKGGGGERKKSIGSGGRKESSRPVLLPSLTNSSLSSVEESDKSPPPQQRIEEEKMLRSSEGKASNEPPIGGGAGIAAGDDFPQLRNEYFQDFSTKTTEGEELFSAYEEAKETLKNNKKRQKQIITMLNDQKYIIDEVNIEIEQYQTILAEKEEEEKNGGGPMEEEKREIEKFISSKKEQLEKTKKQYRMIHQELLLCKEQVQETQSLKKRAMNVLLSAFSDYMQRLPSGES